MRTTLGTEIDHPEAHVLDVLTEMGLPMELDAEAGGVRVRHDGIELRGVRVDCRPMPDMLPILATLGPFATGETVLRQRRARAAEGVRPGRLRCCSSTGWAATSSSSATTLVVRRRAAA